MYGLVIGYIASLLLAISLLVNNELKFRWLNMSGNIAFLIYGSLISAFPVICTNSILLLINLYKIARTYNTREAFDLYEFNPGEKIIDKFLRFHESDINDFFPEFKLAGDDNDIRFIVLRDMAIANIFVAELREDGTAYVKINYTVPKFRDYKVGTFIFDKEKHYLVSKGVMRIVYSSVANKNHAAFLRKMGFVQTGSVTAKDIV